MLLSLTIKSSRERGCFSFSSAERKCIPYPDFPTQLGNLEPLSCCYSWVDRSADCDNSWPCVWPLTLATAVRLSIRRRDLCQQLIQQKPNRRSAWQESRLGHQVVTSFSWVVKEWFPRRRLPRPGASDAIRNLVMYRTKGELVIQVLIVLPTAGRGGSSRLAYE